MLRDIVSFTFLQTIVNLIRQTIPLISVTITLWKNARIKVTCFTHQCVGD